MSVSSELAIETSKDDFDYSSSTSDDCSLFRTGSKFETATDFYSGSHNTYLASNKNEPRFRSISGATSQLKRRKSINETVKSRIRSFTYDQKDNFNRSSNLNKFSKVEHISIDLIQSNEKLSNVIDSSDL